jgi:anthranilate phosphoribosyltransferase
MKVAPFATEVLRGALARALEGEPLSEPDARGAFDALLEPGTPSALQGAFLAALRARGESPEELAGAARVLRERCARVEHGLGEPLVDTCGTGGDGRGSFNLSSAAALLVGALGVRVAKHGNRSVSSRCGSSDLFAALGVPAPATPAAARAELARTGFVYLHAPHFHPALAGVAPLRRELGVRTAFNLLGPLVNPAAPSHQLVGAATPAAARALAGALGRLGQTRAFVVHGEGGFDEATPVGPFLCLEVEPGGVRERMLDPRAFGLARCRPEELAGGDALENAARLHALFHGERGPLRDALCLNAALVLLLLGRADEPRAAAGLSARALDEGRASALLAQVTGQEAPA